MAVFLFTYKGYQNQNNHLDRIAGKIACFAALGVALFPTEFPKGATKLLWWTPYMKTVHYCSATVLFCSFIFYSLVLFPKSNLKREALSEDKKSRNVIYFFCGMLMILFVAGAGIAGSHNYPIFWLETLALTTFSISWLVKGKADWTLGQVRERLFHYGGRAVRAGGNLLRNLGSKRK
jgi:hypothetical protein